MAVPMICVSWNEHADEVARGWKTLLENNSFVDCSIAAEGKSLKAHRLILSACSPYFHMLFNEEEEKHPIVILIDTSFHMLKILIDFVYNGKVEIPAGQLKPFLELAESLQIKGLNKSLRKDRAINNLGNTAGEKHQCSSTVNREHSRVENSWMSHEDSFSNSCQQCHFHFSQSNKNSAQEGSHDSAEVVQSRATMILMQNHQSNPVHYNPDALENTEENIKQEYFFSQTKILETRNDVLDEVNHVESMCGNLESEMNHGSARAFEGNLELNSYGRVSLHSNSNSALVIQQQPLQQHREQELQQQQHNEQQLQQQQQQQQQQQVSHSACVLPSPPDLTEQNDQLLPELSVPLSDKADYSESEESTDALDVPGNDTEEMDEETELTREESLDPSSGAEGSPPPQDEDQEQEQTMPVRPGGQRPANSAGTAPSAPELQAHVRLFRMGTLKCRDCNAIFASSGDLEVHKRQHSGTQSFRRGFRGASPTASSDLAPHQRQLAAERQYSCDVCGKAFAKAGALALHKHRHKGKRRHSCDVCGKAFTTAAAVALHKRWHKRERRRSQPRGVSGKAFVKAATRALHKRSHSRERPHSCNECGKDFTTLKSLIIHKRIHTGERPYSCDVCGKAFIISSHLIVHKRTHTGERPYACDVCGKAFNQSIHLIGHNRTHTGERPFSCDVCGKSFKQLNHLTDHKRTHTGERPYSCDVCGKTFIISSALIVHKRTHTGERPYSCDVCGKAFKQSRELILHKRTHTGERPFSCDVCGKAFKQSVHLTGHNRTHTGERPFSCDVCGKSFKQLNHLTAHKRTHTGERPFSCDVCGKTFKQSVHLTGHKRTHTAQRQIGCDACLLRFSSKASMILHWQRVHVPK